MNADSPIILIGIGTAGSDIAREVNRSFGGDMRLLLIDTDASTGRPDEPFVLMGGDRLSGHGTGGDVVAGRLAAEDSVKLIDERLAGIRLAVLVTALGGGTGGGVTLETVRHLADLGIPTVVFATSPFAFEGEDRQRNARGVMSMIEDAASTTFFLPLDKLVGQVDNMDAALQQARSVLAAGITLFWRLVEKPGYIRLDAERLRHLASGAGRGRFATVTLQGPNRAADALDALIRSEMLSTASGPVRSTLCGILAGEDLLLSEVGRIADGVRESFGGLTFDLATVNDEATFHGSISVVVMLFESSGRPEDDAKPGKVMGSRRRKSKGVLSAGPTGRGRFQNAEPTIWNGEDLDIPTFIRKGISIDL